MQTINVYGTGVNAVKFVLQAEDVKINAYIEGKNKDKKEFMLGATEVDVPVVQIEDAYTTLRENYTVIASSEKAYWEIKKRLENEFGLCEFENFEYYETFKKKVAVIYGNCHIVAIKEKLKQSREFSQSYGFYPLPVIYEMKEIEEMTLPVLKKCDLFMHQCIREENVYGSKYASNYFIQQLKEECRVIGIPNLIIRPSFLFPQIREDVDTIYWEGNSFFPYRDRYIDENYNKLSVNEIEDLIRDPDLIPASDILEAEALFFDKVKMREKEWDVKILDWLKEKEREERLYYDQSHPADIVIKYIVKKIFEILEISDDGEFDDRRGGLVWLDNVELPIYESVRKVLKLEYETKYIRKYSNSRFTHHKMDLKEYIQQYIKWNYPTYMMKK